MKIVGAFYSTSNGYNKRSCPEGTLYLTIFLYMSL